MRHYRKEIDGLRAIAVVSVILFHADIKGFTGGFVGVDVFFVISGYLITTIIVSECSANKFSLRNFYERRVRRIIPALVTVILACLPFSYILMTPGQLKEFGQSVLAISVFSSNILFWRQSGYFGTHEKPLLHTWSLSVEEQFYVIFPLLVIAAWRFGLKGTATLVFVTAFSSLALAIWASEYYPLGNFFLLPTRAWELLIGSALAIWLFNNPALSNSLSSLVLNILSILGLSLIVFSVYYLNARIPFPGLYALLPTVGTALLLISATPATLVHKLLSLPPLVGIGLISYSAYLWHLPLFVFARLARYREGAHLYVTQLEFLVLGAVSLVLAWLTWVFVEQRFREKDGFHYKKPLWMPIAASISVFLAGSVIVFQGGFPNRNPLILEAEQRLDANAGFGVECDYGARFLLKDECATGEDPNLIVWGDSNAMQLVPGLLAANPELSIAQATRSNCPPIIGIGFYRPYLGRSQAANCVAFNESVFSYIESTQSIRYVVLSAFFEQYIKGIIFTSDGLRNGNNKVILKNFIETITRIQKLGKEVWVISPAPAYGGNTGRCLKQAILDRFDPRSCDYARERYEDFQSQTIELFRKLEKNGVSVSKLPNYICSNRTCFASKADVLLYTDAIHLSHEGSHWLGLNTDAFRPP